jgi:hypothetical protein
VTDDWFEDPVRLLRFEPFGDDVARRALTITSELLWDDLLDNVEADTVADAVLIGLLPASSATAPPAIGGAGSPHSPPSCGSSVDFPPLAGHRGYAAIGDAIGSV